MGLFTTRTIDSFNAEDNSVKGSFARVTVMFVKKGLAICTNANPNAYSLQIDSNQP